ncbi:MAG: hypothetical protein ACKVT1_07545, partial [Dehalococcoidia bacterium]
MEFRSVRRPFTLVSRRDEPLSLSIESPGRVRERLWNVLPVSLSLFLASSIFWAPFYAAWAFAVGIVLFFGYWVIRSYAVVFACF